MTTGRSVIEGPYLRDILDQPRALADTRARLVSSPPLDLVARDLARARYRRVVLSGMGSSFFGLHPLHLRLVDAGHHAFLVESSELIHYHARLLDEETLLVLASQSGRSAEIVRLLDLARGRVHTLGVTNTTTSPLARESTAVVLTHAGEEATVSCKTYLAAQAALAWLGSLLLGEDTDVVRECLGSVASGVSTYLGEWRAHVESLLPVLEGIRVLYYAGRGPSFAAAASAGLITKESTHRPSEGMTSAAFRHGPIEMLSDAIFLLAFAGDARTRSLNVSLVEDARAAGARAWLASEEAETPAFRLPAATAIVRPVVELLPVEMITLALAALDGREAGTFTIAGKVTTRE